MEDSDSDVTKMVAPTGADHKENRLLPPAAPLHATAGASVEEAEDFKVIGGRPQIDIDPEKLEGLARIFCTIEEAASVFNVSSKTLMRRLKLEPWKGAWNRGLQVGRISLRRLQWRHANGQGGSAVAMTIWMSRQHLGETDRAPGEAYQPPHWNGGGDAPSRNGGLPRIVIEGGLPEVSPVDLPELPPPEAPIPHAGNGAAGPAVPAPPRAPDDDGLA